MSAGLVSEILPWAAPPVIGALIGWVTNDIAIRMLFRPLREWRVFGIRVPFTPGIFPKERHTLARSIGNMVSRELITEEALTLQLRSDKAQAALARGVSSLSAELLSSHLSSLASLAGGASPVPVSLRDVVHGLLQRMLGSRTLIHAVRELVSRIVAGLSSRKARDLAGSLGLKAAIVDRLLPRLAQPGAAGSVGPLLARTLRENARELLTDQLLESAAEAVKPYIPKAVERLSEWLGRPATRAMLAAKGRELIPRLLLRLNMLQRFFLSAGQFEQRLDEKMPEIVEEVIRSLEGLARDPAQQQKVLEALVAAARDWRDGLGDSAGDSGRSLETGLASVFRGLLSGLANPRAREKAYELLEASVLGTGDPTLGSLAARIGVLEDDVKEYVSNKLLAYLSSEQTARTLSSELVGLAQHFVAEHAESSLGSLLRIDAGRKESLDAFLLERLLSLIETRLPEILRGIDVEDLVVRKIDGLDVREVERLLRGIISTHLRWINVFGAILGFFIGLAQIGLRLLGAG